MIILNTPKAYIYYATLYICTLTVTDRMQGTIQLIHGNQGKHSTAVQDIEKSVVPVAVRYCLCM